MRSTDLAIRHDAAAARFTTEVQGLTCEARYQLVHGTMWLIHTAVPPALQGRGIAAALVRAALDHARAMGWRVRPLCSYVRRYMQRHPDTVDLLAG